jgi:hypothetical protein
LKKIENDRKQQKSEERRKQKMKELIKSQKNPADQDCLHEKMHLKFSTTKKLLKDKKNRTNFFDIMLNKDKLYSLKGDGIHWFN